MGSGTARLERPLPEIKLTTPGGSAGEFVLLLIFRAGGLALLLLLLLGPGTGFLLDTNLVVDLLHSADVFDEIFSEALLITLHDETGEGYFAAIDFHFNVGRVDFRMI